MEQKKESLERNQGACLPVLDAALSDRARASFLSPLAKSGAGSRLQAPSAVTLSCAALAFITESSKKARAEINTLSYVFAELRPEEIEKHSSQHGTEFTGRSLEMPVGLIKRHFIWKAPESRSLRREEQRRRAR